MLESGSFAMRRSAESARLLLGCGKVSAAKSGRRTLFCRELSAFLVWAMGFSGAAFAETYMLSRERLGEIRLNDPGVWEDGVVPSGSGYVIMTHTNWISGVGYQNVTVKDAESFDILKNAGEISISYGTRFAVHCDDDMDLSASVKGSGTFVKDGKGELRLLSHKITGTIYYDLETSYCVTNGTLRLPVSDDAKAYTHSYNNFYIAEGATLVPVQNGTTQCDSLNGAGAITGRKESGTPDEFIMYGRNSTNMFHGTISGLISIRATAAYTLLSNANSTYSGVTDIRGYSDYKGFLETPFIGMVNQPSPFGTNKVIALNTGGGMLRYIGEGETTDKTFNLLESPSIIDAGPHGGLVFTGYWQPYSSYKKLIKIYLTGSNAVPCVVKGTVVTILDKDTNDRYYPYYITKQGTGTWRFEQTADKSLTAAPQGVFAVEQGTLEFNTVSNAGKYCALGYATELYRRDADVPSEDAKVGYAWLLGGIDDNGLATEGRMLYTGSCPVQITNRPLALATAGAFGTAQARIRLFDVRPEGGGAKTLALEAPAGITNDLYDVAGTETSPVGIVKRGEGTWRIGGNVSLGGAISVDEGELVVENRPKGSAYTWFRLTVKQTAATCPRYRDFTNVDGVVTNYNSSDRYVIMGEFALFDADGNRINLGISQAETPIDVMPGTSQIGFDAPNAVTFNTLVADTACLFDNMKTSPDGAYLGGMRFYTKTQIDIDRPETWVPIVFRLTNGTDRAVSLDWVNPGTTRVDSGWGQRYPTAMMLEGSNDGVHWEKVWEDNEIELPTGSVTDDITKTIYCWASNSDGWWQDYHTKRKASAGKSLAFSQTGQLRETAVLASIPELSVAAGASFRVEADPEAALPKVGALVIDGSAGAGRVAGVAFDECGSIDIRNSPLERVSVPLGFAGVEGVGNLKNWVVTIDGEAPGKRVVTVSADGSMLSISGKGLVMVVR